MEYESKLSDIIASLPEVTGGFLYSQERGLYSNQAGTGSSDAALQNVCQKLSKVVSMMAIHFNDTGGIRVTFNNLALCGMMLKDGNWLFLLHQPSLTPGMLKMTVQMAMNLQPEDNPPPAQQEQATQASETASGGGCSIAELMSPDHELNKPLTAIQEELATHIGPVAELVFGDQVESWCKKSTPSLAKLPELIAMFEEEIDDKDDRNAFRENLKKIT